MNVEAVKAFVLSRVLPHTKLGHGLTLKDDLYPALDRLILEVQASLPCAPAWTEASHSSDPYAFDLVSFCPEDCKCPCPSCTARKELGR